MIVMVEYRDIPGFPGYVVGSDGTVWSVRSRNKDHAGNRHLMSATRKTFGYRQIVLSRGNEHATCLVHRLVLLAFVGPCPEGMECCHSNGDCQDNRLENLRWDTPASNHQDQIIHGTCRTGERNPNAVLTDASVRQIREMSKQGLTQKAIAEKFGIKQEHVSSIVNRKSWRHVG